MTLKAARCPPGTLHARAAADTNIDWVPSDGSGMRSYKATCSFCSPVIYEWGLVGGNYRIRRTDLQAATTHLTPAVPRPQAIAWWLALTGHTP